MKVLQINSFGNLSTGNIMVGIYETLKSNGYEGKVSFARNNVNQNIENIKIGNKFNIFIDVLMTRITDRAGFYSIKATKKLIKEIEQYNPDIIHLHNLHGYYLNIEILFNYLKGCNKPVVWTLHDCWAFTGHCCYYSMAMCDKWKSRCYNCIQKDMYPVSKIFDNSEKNYMDKKRLFCGLKNMTIVTVSKWLESEVSKSFLSEYPSEVIYNGIDLNIFKPTTSNIREKYGLQDKFVILGVASTWDKRKGIDDFVKLSNMLDDRFRIVLVGISAKENKRLPESIIKIERTNNANELAELYSMSDVFFNASIEETFGLPTIESIACGTPTIVYDTTASPEIVNKEYGYIVRKNDVEKVYDIVNHLYLEKGKKISDLNYIKNFDKNTLYLKYINLYNKILDNY